MNAGIRLMLPVALFGLTYWVPSGAQAQQLELPVETRNFMRLKMQHSQQILEGLMLENFNLIERHAQEMSLLSMESQWNVLRTQKYVDQSGDFRHAIQHLIDAAREKKMDATALAFVDVTLKCIQCHRYVRGPGAKEGLGLNSADKPTADTQVTKRVE
jgi:hypothetical protein